MDYILLREKVELIIRGLEVMHSNEAEDEFIRVLDDFTQRQITRCQQLKANQESQRN
jgi:hypothetical protein